MSTFTDTFSAANGTSLDGYNGWHRRSGDANTASIVGHQVTIANGGVALFLSPAAPSGSSVNISATLVVPSTGSAAMIAGVVGQADSTGQSYYGLFHNGIVNSIQLYSFVSGTATLLSSFNTTLGAGTYQLELDLRPGQQTGKLNNTVILSTSNSSVPAGSLCGIIFNSTLGSGADSISAFSAGDSISIIAPNDSRLANAYSPLQWRVTATAATANILGSEMNFTFSGTSCSLGLDLSHWSSAAGGYPVVSYSVDNGPQTVVQLSSGQTSLAIATGITSATHTARITWLIANNTSMSRWNDDGTGGGPACSLRITSLAIDAGATVGSAYPFANILLLLGDSISECDYSAPGTFLAGDPRTDFSYQIGEAVGLVTSRITYAGTGYIAGSGDNIPAVGTHWKNFDSIHPRPVSTVASSIIYVVVMHGVNDISASASAAQAAAQALYADLLAQLPNATLLVYVPFGQAIAGTITAAVAATASSRVKLRNLGSAWSVGLTNTGVATYQSADGTHPNTMTHALLRGAMVSDIRAAIAASSTTTSTQRSAGGGLLGGI